MLFLSTDGCSQSHRVLLYGSGCSTRVPGLVNFGPQTPEIHASYYCFFEFGLTTYIKIL